MGEPATELDAMDSAKDWVEKSNGFRHGWIEVKTIVQEPVVNPLSASFYRSDLMCECRQVSTNIQLSVISVMMEGHNVTVMWQVRIYDTGDRWYEENKKMWATDRALGYTCVPTPTISLGSHQNIGLHTGARANVVLLTYCAYWCVGWGWWVNFNKGCAVSQLGTNPWDDIARQTESMLKSVEKCGMVKSIKCSGHVERSQNCDFSRVNGFHDVICKFEQNGLSRMEFAIGRLQRAETGRYGYKRKKTS